MAAVGATRFGAILAVADVPAASAWYRDRLGFEVEATFEDPDYAILTLAGARLSLAEQGHPAEDRPGVELEAPVDPARLQANLVIEVADCRAAHADLVAQGVSFLTEPFAPPWGGARVFAIDPDGYLVELEELPR
ncbi:MAG TPA: VOC family protein [Solirubrobacterales bacterium]|nr:VOC family protein [Solirubrobacterales bacterium]